MEKAESLIRPIIESGNSPNFGTTQKKQKPRLLIQKIREDLKMFDTDHAQKSDLPSLESVNQYSSDFRKTVCAKPRKVRGSMFCTELWSSSQRREAMVNLGYQPDKIKVKKIVRESPKLSGDYTQGLRNRFLNKYPEDDSKEVLRQLTTQYEDRESSKHVIFVLFVNSESPRSPKSTLNAYDHAKTLNQKQGRQSNTENNDDSTQTARFSTAGTSQTQSFSAQLNDMFGSIVNNETSASPSTNKYKIRSHFAKQKDSTALKEAKIVESDPKPEFFTPQMGSKGVRSSKRESKDFIITKKVSFQVSTPKY